MKHSHRIIYKSFIRGGRVRDWVKATATAFLYMRQAGQNEYYQLSAWQMADKYNATDYKMVDVQRSLLLR